jgi:HAD superfamily phosphatase (TIGR01668 family)
MSKTLKKQGLIMNFFKPSLYVRSFKDVNLYSLKAQGIKVFICDLDNTLVPHYKKLPNKDVLEFVKEVKSYDMKIIVVSNNAKNRVKLFCDKAGIDEYYGAAKKPLKGSLVKIMENHKVKSSEVVIMGDQIVMDILVANRIKAESILVQPLVSSDYKMNKFNI